MGRPKKIDPFNRARLDLTIVADEHIVKKFEWLIEGLLQLGEQNEIVQYKMTIEPWRPGMKKPRKHKPPESSNPVETPPNSD